jgi:hypothetical protein
MGALRMARNLEDACLTSQEGQAERQAKLVHVVYGKVYLLLHVLPQVPWH